MIANTFGKVRAAAHRRIKRLFYKSVDWNMPRLSALLLALTSRKVNKKGEKKVLYLGSRISLDDIYAMAKYSGRYQYIYIERFYLGYILKKFVGYSDINENNYYVDERYLPGRKDTYEYVDAMFRHLKVYLGFDALMSSNIGYIDQQELFQIARDRGVPVIVLLKEGMVHPKNEDEYFSVYENKRAICDLFLCYNESIKKCILRLGVPGLNDEKMKVTGIPRCDYYVQEDGGNQRDQLVFFTFDTDVKFREVIHDEKRFMQAREIGRHFCHNVLELALRRPDIRVVVKTKPNKRYRKEMEEVAGDYYGGSQLPENLVVTEGGSAKDLVLESRWVLGINNSTTLLEALLVSRPIGCPDFSSVVDPAEWDFFSDMDEHERPVAYISNVDELLEFVNWEGDTSGPAPASGQAGSQSILKHYLYSTDGRASARAERELAALF